VSPQVSAHSSRLCLGPAASVTDPDGAALFRTFFLADRRRAIGELWARAVERDEVDTDVDVEVGRGILFGPLIFRLHRAAGLDDAGAEAIARAALHGLLGPEEIELLEQPYRPHEVAGLVVPQRRT
jgi:hypothetical protein